MTQTGWANSVSKAYYILGAGYYLYKWSALAGGISGIVAGAAFGVGHRALALAALVLGALLGGASFSLWMFKAKAEARSLNPGLEILRDSAVYEYHGEGKWSYTKNVRVRSKRTGVERYMSKFKWTGEGKIQVTSAIPRQVVRYVPIQDGLWDAFEVTFSSPLNKGQSEEISIRMELEEVGRAPAPYLERNVDEPYREGLHMQILLPHAVMASEVTKEIFLSERSFTPVYVDRAPLGTGRLVAWDVMRPRVGCKYKLSWT